MDPLYNKLLQTFRQSSYETYIKERNKVREELRGQKDIDSPYSDFQPYPSYQDDDFNQVVLNKKEFNRYESKIDNVKDFDKESKKRCSTRSFTLSPNQQFIKNFLSPQTPYNSLLLFHSVGVGKTCTAISIAEQYHDLYQKKVLVILSSALIDNFKKQIFDITKYDIKTHQANLCTGTTYPEEVIDRSRLKPEELTKRINRLINDKYQFMGYKELALLMDKIRAKIEQFEKNEEKIEQKFNERLSEIFSDRLIIIDEAHNLRNPSETGVKQISTAFKTLLKHVENVKLVLLTATPMFNDAKEITWTMNLLLTNDKRPELKIKDVFDKNGNLTDAGRAKLIDTARGYVSFMRGENPFSFPFRLFPSINEDPNLLTTYPKKDLHGNAVKKIKFLEILATPLSSQQKEVYDVFKKNVDEDTDEDDQEDQEEGANEIQKMMQISNITYLKSSSSDPQRRFGTAGLESCFSRSDKGKLAYKSNNEFLRYDTLQSYAPKIKRILDYIIKSEGIVFVYSRYYASGIIPLAVALEHIGFSKYGNSGNVAPKITVDDKFQGKKPKYIILSRKKELSPNNDQEIAVAKSAANKEGEVIKVIIVSKIGTEGIDFKRIREVHLLEPWFNLNRAEQIIGRAVRNCSHVELPKEKRNVMIYFHAGTYSDQEESVDLRTYRIAENKQVRIAEIEKLLKQTSIDCNLNKDVLVFSSKKLKIKFDITTSQGTVIKKYAIGDRDYSSACGFDKCNVVCVPDTSDSNVETNDDTFDKYFILDEIRLYKQYIRELFQTTVHMNYDTILSKLKKEYQVIDEEVLLYALEDMITNKDVIIDAKERGGYLIYRGDQYILQQTRLTDKYLTLDERATSPRMRRSILFKEIGKPTPEVVSLPAPTTQQTSQEVTQLYEEIENLCATKNAIVTKILGDKTYVTRPKVVDAIIDHVLDHLPLYLLEALLQDLTLRYNHKKLLDTQQVYLKSLVSAGLFHVVDDKIQSYYNPKDGEIYCLKSGSTFKKCNPIDISKNKTFVDQVKQKLSESLREGTKAYVYIKGDSANFKIRDNPKTDGYVCKTTSSLTVSDLMNRLTTMSPDLFKSAPSKMSKPGLCLLYELLNRISFPQTFQRPYFVKIESTKA